MMKKIIIITILVFIGNLFAQGSISGKITRADSGDALLGVNILVAGTFTGTTTNDDGEFEIESLPSGE